MGTMDLVATVAVILVLFIPALFPIVLAWGLGEYEEEKKNRKKSKKTKKQ